MNLLKYKQVHRDTGRFKTELHWILCIKTSNGIETGDVGCIEHWKFCFVHSTRKYTSKCCHTICFHSSWLIFSLLPMHKGYHGRIVIGSVIGFAKLERQQHQSQNSAPNSTASRNKNSKSSRCELLKRHVVMNLKMKNEKNCDETQRTWLFYCKI